MNEWAEIRPREGRPRLQFSPPFRDVGMFLFGYFIRRDFLIDPLDERDCRNIGNRIAVADEPAGRF